MNSSYYINRIKSLNQTKTKIAKDIARKDDDVAKLTKKVNDAQVAILKTKSQSTVASKQREIKTNTDRIQKLMQEKARLQKDMARNTEDLAKAETELSKAQAKEHKDAMDRQNKLLTEQEKITNQMRVDLDQQIARLDTIMGQFFPDSSEENADLSSIENDFFISHASEDKDSVARDLANALIARGFKVWYDEMELLVGDSLRKKIDDGLAHCKYGIVIISPDFVRKNWTEYELNGMVAREMNGQQLILPIWHNISMDEILKYSPSLADKKALKTSDYTIEQMADAFSARFSRDLNK